MGKEKRQEREKKDINGEAQAVWLGELREAHGYLLGKTLSRILKTEKMCRGEEMERALQKGLQ